MAVEVVPLENKWWCFSKWWAKHKII